ncbi:MAG: HPF/RaiA family ribosome-associated protein, partial [Georgfuchsia sp.]
RVEVHLTDEIGQMSSHKSGKNDKCCTIEARLEGRQPIAVTHQAETFRQAADGAAKKLTRMIESTLGRLRDQRHDTTAQSSPGSKLTEE